MIDFVLRKDENYYLEVFLKECKYTEKEAKVVRYITNDLEIFSDDSDKEQFSFNERITNSQKHEEFALCKLFKTSLGYLYPLNYLILWAVF